MPGEQEPSQFCHLFYGESGDSRFDFCLSIRTIAQSKRMYSFSAITIMVFSYNFKPSRSLSYAKIMQGESRTK